MTTARRAVAGLGLVLAMVLALRAADVDYAKAVADAEQTGDAAAVRRLCSKWAAAEPGNADALFAMARALAVAENHEKAREYWERFLVQEPASERARAVRNGWVVLAQKLVATSKDGFAPSVSPDGTRLICGARDLQLANMRDGSVVKLRITDGKVLRFSRWSPDGKRVAASLGYKLDYQAVIYEFRSDASLEPVAAPEDAHANWAELSPDGAQLLLSDCRKHPGVHLAVFELATGALIPVESMLPTERGWGSTASWGPDGESIAFHAHGKKAQDDRAVFVQRVDDPSSVVQLTRDGRKNIGAMFSPDGLSVVFYDPGPLHPVVRIARADGSGQPVKVSDLGATPAWLPGGRGIAYTGSLKGKHGVIVAHLGGLDPRPVAITTERKGKTLSATVTSRTNKVQQVAVRWEVFDKSSSRIGPPSGSAEPVELKPGERIEWSLELNAEQQKNVQKIKVRVLNQDGVGAVKLTDWLEEEE